MYESWLIIDVVKLVAAGGGIDMDATARSTDELVQIAEAASARQPKVILRGVKGRPVDDLIKIAAAGKGCVIFGD
jgi:DNA replication protein